MRTLLHCILLSSLLLALFGCAGFPATRDAVERQAKKIEQVEKQRKETFARDKEPVKVLDDGYYISGGTRVPISEYARLPKLFERKITLIKKEAMTLEEIASVVTKEFGVPVRIATHQEHGNAQLINAMLVDFNDVPLKVFLDGVAANFSVSWDWLEKQGVIQFYKMKTKTFTVAASIGKVDVSSSISNTSDSGSGSTSGEEVSKQSSSGEQETTLKATYTTWDEIKENIASMLSKNGRVVYSQGAGTVTVTDYPSVLNTVEIFVDQLNENLMRQVAISVKVYALQTDKDKEHSIDINAVFNDLKVNLVTDGAAALSQLSGMGSLTATIIDYNSKLDNSSAVLKTLRTVGDVSLITSGSAVTLNNQPSPIQVVTEESYLAEVSNTSTTDVGTTAELTPGKVTTGFTMLCIPHIIDSKTVILQYSLCLSDLESLDDISSGGQTIQVPTVSTRSVMQRVRMPLGSTLILAGYERQQDSYQESGGLFGWGRRGGHNNELVVIAIEVNSLG